MVTVVCDCAVPNSASAAPSKPVLIHPHVRRGFGVEEFRQFMSEGFGLVAREGKAASGLPPLVRQGCLLVRGYLEHTPPTDEPLGYAEAGQGVRGALHSSGRLGKRPVKGTGVF